MIWIYLMKITLFLLIAVFFVGAVVRLVRKNRDWVEILFYLFIVVVSLILYLYNFPPFSLG
jgi:hypothetical protein